MTRTLAAAVLLLVSFSVFAADGKSEAAAADLLHKRLANENPAAKAMLDAVQGKDVVVVAGSMDHIEEVLAAARIPFTLINPDQVAATQLTSSQILMVNCPGVMPQESLLRIEKFVRAGGLLYTTDWALKNVVEPLFPNTIAHNGKSTGDHVVPVLVDEKSDNMMSQLLLRKGVEPQWWLEGSSYPIAIKDPKRVKVLAHSKQMERDYGAGAVVVRFRHEDGEVIHVVSHFVRQVATKGPAVAAKDAPIEGLTAQQKKDFDKSAGAGASIGDVESSYAFQRMTTNVVTGKQLRNGQLDREYGMTVRAPAALTATPAANAPSVSKSDRGTKLKVLERGGRFTRVRDEFGNEGWLDNSALIAR